MSTNSLLPLWVWPLIKGVSVWPFYFGLSIMICFIGCLMQDTAAYCFVDFKAIENLGQYSRFLIFSKFLQTKPVL